MEIELKECCGIPINCKCYDWCGKLQVTVEQHDAFVTVEEPKRLELRVANTTENLRNKVLAAGNGHSRYVVRDVSDWPQNPATSH